MNFNHLFEGLEFSIIFKEKEEVTIGKFKDICCQFPELGMEKNVLLHALSLIILCKDESQTKAIAELKLKCLEMIKGKETLKTIDFFDMNPQTEISLNCNFGYCDC